MQTTQLNRITLCGIVGSARTVQVNGADIIRFTLATTRACVNRDKTPILETTWFTCQTPSFPGKLEKGSRVMLQGHMQSISYERENGIHYTTYDVIASSVEILPEGCTLLFQDDRKPAPKGGWDFRYDEEYPDTAGRNFAGVLTDGNRFLFWHAFADNEGEMERCHIYGSLRDLAEHENEICSYLWTLENDSRVTRALNSLKDEGDWYGEHCPLSTLEFSDDED